MQRGPASWMAVFACVALGGAACPDKGSEQRAAWQRGVEAPDEGGAQAGEGETGEGETGEAPDSGPAPVDQDTLDGTLATMVDIIAGGLEWSFVDERARELCVARGEDQELVEAEVELADESGSAWSCPIASLDVGEGGVFSVEASAGVISLSASELDGGQSERLAAYARARFASWCADDYERVVENKLEIFYRCSLPQGPYLVIAQFPRDLEQDMWQVSIAVVDAG